MAVSYDVGIASGRPGIRIRRCESGRDGQADEHAQHRMRDGDAEQRGQVLRACARRHRDALPSTSDGATLRLATYAR
jgi:hypothetical protein